jgi:DNA-directed RNA polymerase subunit RPC12/RpoP
MKYKCSRCGEYKAEKGFYAIAKFEVRGRKPYHCKDCQKEINRINNAIRRAEHRRKLNELKLERGCADCGYRKHPFALQFDHDRNQKKRFGLTHSLLYAWETILSEVNKCTVRCANCHAIKTFTNNEHHSKK